MIKFQYYANNSKSPTPLGYVTMLQFLSTVRNPKPEIKEILKQVKEASGDKQKKSELKAKLFSFTPCVNVTDRRAYDSITCFTGLTVLDFDKIDHAEPFKNFLFETYGSVIAAWISPSGKGVKALVKIPIVHSVDEYKRYFFGLASEMEVYKGFDGTTQNPVLPLFIGWDKDILFRTDFTEWNIKGSKHNEFVNSEVIAAPVVDSTDKQKAWVINWFTEKINNISDNGHPQVIGNVIRLGGYVGIGYITHQEATSLYVRMITQNSYLQKGTSGYLKTAETALEKGITKPLGFND